MTMIPLSRFILKQGETELHICRGLGFAPAASSDVSLPLLGAFGKRDEQWAPQGHRLPQLAFEEDEARWGLLEPLRLHENVEYEVVVVCPLSREKFCEQATQADDPVFPFANSRLKDSLSFQGSTTLATLPDGKLQVAGRLRFDNYVGSVDLSLRPEVANMPLRAEVVSSKLDYEHDFEHLLTALANVHAEIVLELDAPTEVMMSHLAEGKQSPQMLLLLLRWLFHEDRLPLAVATILGNPLSRCTSVCRTEHVALVTEPDYLELQTQPAEYDWQHGGPLADTFLGFSPETLPCRTVERRYDVLENRFAKYALKDLLRLVQDVQQGLPRKLKASRRTLSRWSSQLDQFLANPFWQSIGECTSLPNSMVMQERRGYRDLLQQITLLDLTLLLSSGLGEVDPASGDLRPIWRLYELWCDFELRSILANLTGDPGTPTLQSLLKNKKYAVDLLQGEAGCTTYQHECYGEQLEIGLFHARKVDGIEGPPGTWQGSYSTEFKPDFSIRVIRGESTHWICFDAKYRTSFIQRKQIPGGSADEHGNDRVRWVQSDDLNVMHTYRDAILGCRGCYVLYPGNTAEAALYVRHPDPAYRGAFPGPSIGAFPLCPSNTNLLAEQRHRVRDHLDKMFRAIVQSTVYREEDGFVAGGAT